MFRPAIGTLIIAATLAIAGQAAAELPMSPIYRTDHASGTSQPNPGLDERTDPVNAAGKGEPAQSTQTAAPKPAEPAPMAKASGAQAADSAKIVATALIPPPPPLTQPPPSEPPPMPSASVPAEHAAVLPHKPRQGPHPHYAASRYPYPYRYYSASSASNPPHLGPNPYSPNGGD